MKSTRRVLLSVAAVVVLCNVSNTQPTAEFNLQLGPMADYGASPWYTTDIRIGSSRMKLNLDNGANFIWATSDLCLTPACNAHEKFDTCQAEFHWVDLTSTIRSFGPWGSMTTMTGLVGFHKTPPLHFFASIKYERNQFQFLAWDGGIGLPSRSEREVSPTAFFPRVMNNQGYAAEPEFSQVTNPCTGVGKFVFGQANSAYLQPDTRTTLPPPTPIPKNDYLWGTELHSLYVDNTLIKSMVGGNLFFDTGSSRFKGDSWSVKPILQALLQYKDYWGNPIFGKITENDKFVGLEYVFGAPTDYKNLPDITLRLGMDCKLSKGTRAVVTLSPEQYSYRVDVGERAGKWVAAFHVMEGVGGLLVGSIFQNLFYMDFQYRVDNYGNYVQGDMFLYEKSFEFGPGPSGYTCEPIQNHPLEGKEKEKYLMSYNIYT